MSTNLTIKVPDGFEIPLKVPQIGTVDTFRILQPNAAFARLDRYILYCEGQQLYCKKTPHYTEPMWETWQERIDAAVALKAWCIAHRVTPVLDHI